MSGYNHVTLVGNLTSNPETTKDGNKSKTTFTIACDRYAGKNNEPEVDYFNIVTHGKLADIAGEYLKQGKKVLADGRIQVRSSKVDGCRSWITEIICDNIKFLTAKQPVEK